MRRPLAIVVSVLGLTMALAACGKQNPPTPPPASPGQQTGAGTLGEGPGQTTEPPSNPPTTAPNPGETDGPPIGDDVPEPHSTVASRVGYVWVYSPSSTMTLNTPYSYNSAGGAISVTHSATGTYQVVFAGLGTASGSTPGSLGIAHAQAYGNTPNYCNVDRWNQTSGNQNVYVNCYNAAGALTDNLFVVSFVAGSQGNVRFSYVWANDKTNASPYTPSAAYRYDAVSSDHIEIDRTAVGRYDVALPASGPSLSTPFWTFQVTAYKSNALCKLVGFYAPDHRAQVACRTPAGAYVDSQFSLTFAEKSIIGRTDRPFGNFSQSSSGIENPSTGVYVVRVSGVGQAKGYVTAGAVFADATYCHVRNWSVSAPDLNVGFVCFNPGGAPASASFLGNVTL